MRAATLITLRSVTGRVGAKSPLRILPLDVIRKLEGYFTWLDEPTAAEDDYSASDDDDN